MARELGARISAVALAHGKHPTAGGRWPLNAAELIRGTRLPPERSAPSRDRSELAGPERRRRARPQRTVRHAGRADARQAGGDRGGPGSHLERSGAGTVLLVLATEEIMSLPLAVAVRLQELRSGARRPLFHHHPLPDRRPGRTDYAIRRP